MENIDNVLEEGPGLRYSMGIFIIAKDTKNRQVLLGGLGGMGVGQMWFGLGEMHKEYPGFEKAPDIDTEIHDAMLHYFSGKVLVFEKRKA